MTIYDIINKNTAMEIMRVVESLHDRWQDERAYEDFNEYKTHLEKIAKSNGLHFVKLTKRPFKLTVSTNNKVWNVHFHVTSKKGQITATRN